MNDIGYHIPCNITFCKINNRKVNFLFLGFSFSYFNFIGNINFLTINIRVLMYYFLFKPFITSFYPSLFSIYWYYPYYLYSFSNLHFSLRQRVSSCSCIASLHRQRLPLFIEYIVIQSAAIENTIFKV